MNLPKDWTRKPDWLDKAREPSHLGFRGHLLLWTAIALLSGSLLLLAAFLLH